MKGNPSYLIIGAGPAGLQLGYFLQKRGYDYLILERASRAGSFFEKMPRHRTLISINKVFTGTADPEANMRWDWNSLVSDNQELLFKNYSERYFPPAEDFCRYLEDYAAYYDLNIQFETEVVHVKKESGEFVVTDARGTEYRSSRLVVATGIFKPWLPDIPGIELCETYGDHNVDPDLYRNKRVMVVGKGNSGFETADNLIETAAAIHICSPESVKFAWQTHFVGNLRAVNNNFLDTYQLKSQNTVIDATIKRIEKHGDKLRVHLAFSHAQGQELAVDYDHVILCTGFRFDASIFDASCRPELAHEGKFPAQTTEWESVNVPGLYFAGTLMQACDYKKTMSGFIHGFRHNVESLVNLFGQKYEGEPWPVEVIDATPEAVLDMVIQRVNRSPGMFLQPGFLCDVLAISEGEGIARCYKDVRRDYVPNSFLADNEHYYTVSLEYGHFEGDPFSIERDPSPEAADEASYLHPVIRRHRYGEEVSQHHIQDDLESEWRREVYMQPARAFFKAQMATDLKLKPAVT